MAHAPREEMFESAHGTRIFMRSWQPDGNPKAVIVICHGVNSHGGQYTWPAEQFVKDGFAVYALDLRGRGKSEGERFYVENVADYVSRRRRYRDRFAKSRHPGLPVFLLGHSAGGVTSAAYTLDNQAELRRIRLRKLRVPGAGPGFALRRIKGLSHIAPRLPVLEAQERGLLARIRKRSRP